MSTFTPTGALRNKSFRAQTDLEELWRRPVGPIVFVYACITFDIIFINRIEVDKSDLLVDFFNRRVDGSNR